MSNSIYNTMNRMPKLFLVIISVLVATQVSGQDLMIHKEFLDAVEKGTRTLDGVPGEKYWVNHSDYKLDAKVSFVNDTVSRIFPIHRSRALLTSPTVSLLSFSNAERSLFTALAEIEFSDEIASSTS